MNGVGFHGTNGIPREDCPNYGRVIEITSWHTSTISSSSRKETMRNHLEVLQQVLEGLRKYRLRLRREKCSLACKAVYLGYQVSTFRIAAQYDYLDRILAWPKPKYRDELRAYLGLFPFLSMFSTCTSSVLRPFQNFLGKKRSMLDWSSEHDDCFEASKLLFDGQELVNFDDMGTIEVHTNASAYGLGGVLIQNDKPVLCVSASMTESQKVWSATDRELLAVKHVVKKLYRFFWGRSFIVVTDHEPLLGLFQKKEFATKRQEKVVLSMLEFEFPLRYKHGKLMIFSDALSRVPATVAGIVKTVTQE